MIRPTETITLRRRGEIRETPVSRITHWRTTRGDAAVELSRYFGEREKTYRPLYRVLDLSSPTPRIVSRHRFKRRAAEAAVRLAIQNTGDLQ